MIQLAGRIYVRRSAGSKLFFYDIRSDGTRLQVLAQADNLDDKAPSFDEQHVNLRRGDIIGIRGFPTRTNPKTKQGSGEYSGELSIAAVEITLLSPCLHQVCFLPSLQPAALFHDSICSHDPDSRRPLWFQEPRDSFPPTIPGSHDE